MNNFTISDRKIFVNHQANKRSGHMGHAMVDCGKGRILDFYSNVDYDKLEGHSGYGWMEYKISEDYGKTFGEAHILSYSMKLYREGKHTALCEKAVKLPDGRILLFFQITDATLLPACEPWSAPTMSVSYDNGETFSDGIDIGADKGRIYDAFCDKEYVYFLMQSNPYFIGKSGENVYKVYRMSVYGDKFVPFTLPFDAGNKGYGALSCMTDGSLIAYVYDLSNEFEPQYSVSFDNGETWSEPKRTYLDMMIRNPQLQHIDNEWFLIGRNGNEGDGLVLYHSNDGMNWENGIKVDTRPDGGGIGYYSNMLPIIEPGQPKRILMQYSHVYDKNRVNIAHRLITLK